MADDEDISLSSWTLKGESQLEAWYRPVKHVPMRIHNNGDVTPAIFQNNERHVVEHWTTYKKTIEKFLSQGAIELMPTGYRPMLSATFVMANADSEIKKPRACYDGGAYKVLEAYKTPCKLDGLPEVTKIIQPGFKIGKIDDSSGFYLMKLNKESRDLCCVSFGGRFFRYKALAFGERKSPSTFQRGNMAVVNFLRR